MKIDYTYIHNKKCALITYLESALHIMVDEQVSEEIKKAMEDVAYNEANRTKKATEKMCKEELLDRGE